MGQEQSLKWVLEQYVIRQEEWRPVLGYEGRYEVSSHGRVRGLCRSTFTKGGGHNRHIQEKIMSPSEENVGSCLHRLVYRRIKLCDGHGNVKRTSVSRLVAQSFIPNPGNLPCVDHICGTEGGDGVWNLRWCTYKENSNYDLAKMHQSVAVSGERNHEYGRLGADNPKSKPVAQYDENGELIKVYASQADAYRETGINNINAAVKGRQRTAGGYIWKEI